MNPSHRPFTRMLALVAGLTLAIALAMTGLALGGREEPLPAGAASPGRTPAALPLATNTPVPGTWSTTGNLNTARRNHTATLLGNGQVLAAGGFGSTYLTSAELYDPATGVWTPTGNLNTARDGQTATLLANGQVLVAGGQDISGNSLSSAELYNPAMGAWTYTGSLHDARQNHTATLLPNRQVLVAGGCGMDYPFCTILSSAELYNPATGTWTPTGNLHDARTFHTATLLASGQVLVAGGCADSSCSPLASAELYNGPPPVLR